MVANEMLQRRLRVALDVRNKGRQHGARDLSRLDGADARFRWVWLGAHGAAWLLLLLLLLLLLAGGLWCCSTAPLQPAQPCRC